MKKDNLSIKLAAKIQPVNVTLKEINWNPILKEFNKSNFISVNDLEKKEEDSSTKTKEIHS